MTTYLGKSCSFGLPRVAFRKLPSIYVFSYFPFGFEGRMWDLIVSVPNHYLSFYFLQAARENSEIMASRIDEALPGFLGNRRTRAFCSGE